MVVESRVRHSCRLATHEPYPLGPNRDDRPEAAFRGRVGQGDVGHDHLVALWGHGGDDLRPADPQALVGLPDDLQRPGNHPIAKPQAEFVVPRGCALGLVEERDPAPSQGRAPAAPALGIGNRRGQYQVVLGGVVDVGQDVFGVFGAVFADEFQIRRHPYLGRGDHVHLPAEDAERPACEMLHAGSPATKVIAAPRDHPCLGHPGAVGAHVREDVAQGGVELGVVRLGQQVHAAPDGGMSRHVVDQLAAIPDLPAVAQRPAVAVAVQQVLVVAAHWIASFASSRKCPYVSHVRSKCVSTTTFVSGSSTMQGPSMRMPGSTPVPSYTGTSMTPESRK